jgi:hypothetical protein
MKKSFLLYNNLDSSWGERKTGGILCLSSSVIIVCWLQYGDAVAHSCTGALCREEFYTICPARIFYTMGYSPA